MTLLTTRDLGLTFAAPLFSGLSLTIHPGDRIGLIAANGRGKSALLACLSGALEPTHGEITRARGLITGHLAQDIPAALSAATVEEVVAGGLTADLAETESWRVGLVLDELAIPEELRSRPLGALSGGWQRMAMLARVWIGGPDLLLMDEPTNHLDLARIGWLQGWIASLPRDFPLLIASHDRAFLDAVTNRSLFLRETVSRDFALPYSRARAALVQADAADDRQHRNDMKKADQLRRQAAKLKNIGINSGSDLLITKTRQLKNRAERIEQAARPAWRESSSGAIRLDPAVARARALLRLDGMPVPAPDGRVLFTTGRKWIGPGDRVLLLGPNGAGKTRLIEALHAACQGRETEGLSVAASLRLGYSDQALTGIDGDETPLAAICARSDIGDQTARGLLAGAGISFDAQGRPAALLSGGQRARLAMLALRLERPNFYLMDEPTNHLDIEGQEALEAELTRDEVSCLLVSHDRAFVRAVANRFWVIEGKRLVELDDPEDFFAAELARGMG
ncbi:ABC-F family ATP-binding cassette domain-containing protein [Frigidibacter sp. ROC022]|uniref:ABC-F family ATP-binding cassette domain-containing protein n=1 Tax=Frigidibacter sp. ROC022 TaxID=2971796 RepID=UPI00215B14B3|nr:ABC-F family ATP-binding cassette domain-containing protein [Frigidibacter sp. ROC022]MCR8723018.1 ATP-binding cassette domain-containing protein [Frigidibacter sp. ROC022]